MRWIFFITNASISKVPCMINYISIFIITYACKCYTIQICWLRRSINKIWSWQFIIASYCFCYLPNSSIIISNNQFYCIGAFLCILMRRVSFITNASISKIPCVIDNVAIFIIAHIVKHKGFVFPCPSEIGNRQSVPNYYLLCNMRCLGTIVYNNQSHIIFSCFSIYMTNKFSITNATISKVPCPIYNIPVRIC